MITQPRKTVLSAKEAAAKAGVSTSHITKMCREGKIPAYKIGRPWVIPVRGFKKWLAEREVRRCQIEMKLK